MRLSERDFEVLANIVCKLLVGRSAEDLETVVVAMPLRLALGLLRGRRLHGRCLTLLLLLLLNRGGGRRGHIALSLVKAGCLSLPGTSASGIPVMKLPDNCSRTVKPGVNTKVTEVTKRKTRGFLLIPLENPDLALSLLSFPLCPSCPSC